MSAGREELPAVSRRRVRLALRAARDRSGLTLADVADKLRWSRSKLQRIELGEVNVTPTDLRAVLDLYQVTDEQQIAALLEETHIARRERYWVNPAHRKHLTPGLVQLLQFELAATTIREYQPTMVAGYLQTPGTAEATLTWSGFDLTDDARRVLREVRLARRAKVIERDGAPDYRLLLDESTLWRMIGDMETMAAQFEDLAASAALPNVRVRMVPMDAGAVMGMFGSFSVIHLGAEPEDAILYRETYTRDDVVEEWPEVRFHLDVFDRFWDEALGEEASRAQILARAYELRAKIARGDRL